MAHAYKVKIAARLRPPIYGEINDDGVQVVHNDDDISFISVPNPRDASQIFKFPLTSCYDPLANQEDIFENDVRPMIDVVYSGVTVTVFAYGVTSSGKTHTMQGTKSDPGIIPRAVEALFEKQSGLQRYHASLAVSYMEIYKDEVYDLLVARDNAPKLPVRENDSGQVFVANLTSLPVDSLAEFDKIYTQVPTLSGKLNLVDLAGSENNKMTGNDPSRMAESAAINKSLSVLGQVVHAINQGASRIPYRNSKLTRLLQDALGGSSVGLLICNLAPGVKFRQDTLNTLNFAVRTKNIENKPVVNERDNRPIPKPHFAAIQPSGPKLAAAVLPVASSSSSGSSRPSLVPSYPVPTRPNSTNGSRVPRPSMANFGGSSSLGPRLSQVMAPPPPPRATYALTDKEIDERIARAVEAEVARRLEERERERDREEDARRAAEAEERAKEMEKQKQKEQQRDLSCGQEQTLHSSEDLESELKKRLEELEQKMFVQQALARKIIEIEWAVNHGKPFQPSPKRPRKHKAKKAKAVKNGSGAGGGGSGGGSGRGSSCAAGEGSHRNEESLSRQDVLNSDVVLQLAKGSTDSSEKENLGVEVTNNSNNHNSLRSPKRQADAMLEDDSSLETPPPKSKKGKMASAAAAVVREDGSDDDWEQWEPPAPGKKSKKRNAVLV
ncbi:hypothetical protein PHLCEN_2v13370 [Hermanssonia centrifuga]|uniref:Kinesin-like protein n=1 Tax=Hermanssonia centrifuga TaxID=98765 RepID=A0A2R6NEE3_9APHY|nr:hypothetical protein PHLCEN_2v13370 [Hermanssonia centrifuga]